jgi:Fic family protein
MTSLPQPTTARRPSRLGRPTRASYHQRVEQGREELQRLGGLPSPNEAAEIWTAIWYDESHNSTALEGNTLVIAEVEALLRDKQVVGEKPHKDYLEVTGYAKAAEWVYRQAMEPKGWGGDKLLTVTEVRQVHREVLTPSWDWLPDPGALPEEFPGNWRRHNIQPFRSGMTPPDWTEVPARVQNWVAGMTDLEREGSPIAEKLAVHHAAFEQIHPFIQGNGRTGRLLVNLALVRAGYPPTIIRYRDRDKYLDALSAADHGDPGSLGELIARGIYENLTRFILPALAGEVRLLPLDALATEELSLRALRGAAERGRLKVVMGRDRTWRSSKKWVTDYKKSRWASLRQPRGPRSRTVFATDSATGTESATAMPAPGFGFSISGAGYVTQPPAVVAARGKVKST